MEAQSKYLKRIIEEQQQRAAGTQDAAGQHLLLLGMNKKKEGSVWSRSHQVKRNLWMLMNESLLDFLI
jgi:hypothetical protein